MVFKIKTSFCIAWVFPIPIICKDFNIHYNEHNELYEKKSVWFFCVSYYIGNQFNQTNSIMRCDHDCNQ
jgi:hypothetical protein